MTIRAFSNNERDNLVAFKFCDKVNELWPTYDYYKSNGDEYLAGIGTPEGGIITLTFSHSIVADRLVYVNWRVL